VAMTVAVATWRLRPRRGGSERGCSENLNFTDSPRSGGNERNAFQVNDDVDVVPRPPQDKTTNVCLKYHDVC
jgi:hypothetical protein